MRIRFSWYIHTLIISYSNRFKDDVDSGLVEIIAPSASFYPDLKSIKSTLGDSDERTRWRTKQNLDCNIFTKFS